MNLRQNIQRALRVDCTADILGHFTKRHMTVQHFNTRTAFGRALRIIAWLSGGAGFNSSDFAQLCCVSTKTIQRDIEALRSIGAEIVYVDAQHVYRLVRPFAFQIKTGGAR